jgi:hypothetical protein
MIAIYVLLAGIALIATIFALPTIIQDTRDKHK